MDLAEAARSIRLNVLNMVSSGGSSHVGAAFSCIDVLTVLYGDVMTVDPKNPEADNRDRFVLSKGHAGAAVYATLAEFGFFPKEKLKTHYQDGSDLSGHVSHKGIPGVEISTGSLGHGLGIMTGMAKAAKMSGKEHRVFGILSDGECDEGSTWEAALFAAHHGLDNMTAIIDYNKIQSLAPVADTIKLEPFRDKWESFGCAVEEVDGHDYGAMKDVFGRLPFEKGKPNIVIAHTTKGKGVSFMEDTVLWHYRCPKGEEFDAAKEELES